MPQTPQLLTIKEASRWASHFLKRDIGESNISYLIQYGKVRKFNGGSATCVHADDLKQYYQSFHGRRETLWKKQLGNDLNWALSFDHLREKDTTKHVHRLHPYKGKFIPQLVQYFIDDHVDAFKKAVYFRAGDILLDPFAGSGTTLVQANEAGIHAIGLDISSFNCMIAEAKLLDYNFATLRSDIQRLQQTLADYETDHRIRAFEEELCVRLAEFNNRYFPSPEFKYRIQQNQIDEHAYGKEKEEQFLNIYNNLVRKYGISLNSFSQKTFLDQWYIPNVREETRVCFEQIRSVRNAKHKKILAVILSRTIRSCRATTHSDLATLKQPQTTTYYCWKHKKICKPIFSIKSWLDRYANDTLRRLQTFSSLKTSAHQAVLSADSRMVNISEAVRKKNPAFHQILKQKKIAGIFTSPPYVGQIDYHEQHAYAYDLFAFERKDEFEIGPLYKGQGAEARASYVEGISSVLQNCKPYLVGNFDVFLVANDKYNLYPSIAERAGMKIVQRFKRPVLNRTERDKSPYSEIIFHLKNK